MYGTSRLVTAPMRLIPPRITAAMTVAEITPVIQVGTPTSARIWSATVNAWMLLPEPKLEMMVQTANIAASGFQFRPSPFSM